MTRFEGVEWFLSSVLVFFTNLFWRASNLPDMSLSLLTLLTCLNLCWPVKTCLEYENSKKVSDWVSEWKVTSWEAIASKKTHMIFVNCLINLIQIGTSTSPFPLFYSFLPFPSNFKWFILAMQVECLILNHNNHRWQIYFWAQFVYFKISCSYYSLLSISFIHWFLQIGIFHQKLRSYLKIL